MGCSDPADALLDALDQFTNAVYWLRSRSDCTAAAALGEALADWTAERRQSADDVDGADSGDALCGFLAAAGDVAAVQALGDALNSWSAAVSAEHHRSTPFQAASRDQTSRIGHR